MTSKPKPFNCQQCDDTGYVMASTPSQPFHAGSYGPNMAIEQAAPCPDGCSSRGYGAGEGPYHLTSQAHTNIAPLNRDRLAAKQPVMTDAEVRAYLDLSLERAVAKGIVKLRGPAVAPSSPVKDAKAQAAQLVADAQAQAEKILADARAQLAKSTSAPP